MPKAFAGRSAGVRIETALAPDYGLHQRWIDIILTGHGENDFILVLLQPCAACSSIDHESGRTEPKEEQPMSAGKLHNGVVADESGQVEQLAASPASRRGREA